jgi:hypothetical protein
MFMSAFDVVVEATLAERWTVSRLSERLVLRVVEDSEVDAVAGGRSVEDVAIPFFVYDCEGAWRSIACWYDSCRG